MQGMRCSVPPKPALSLMMTIASIFVGATLDAITVKINPLTQQHFDALGPAQCNWDGDWKNYREGPGDVPLATLSFLLDRGEMGHYIDESVAGWGRKECAKLGGNTAYLESESHNPNTDYINAVMLRCMRVARPAAEPSEE